MKEKLKNYFTKIGAEIAAEFNLDGYYIITDCLHNIIGIAVDIPPAAREILSSDVWTSDQQTFYWYIKKS